MCGIAAYVGQRDAYPILINALGRVEYRGYDSCGIAICDNHKFQVLKNLGYVQELQEKYSAIPGTVGIGHTRWSTVGQPSVLNAHPHLDCEDTIAIVHNGDIDNYYQLRERLLHEGHQFKSDTDSEVLAHLIEQRVKEDKDLLVGVTEALKEIEGTYGLVVMDLASEVLVAARREAPLVIGVGQSENLVASDVPAILETTEKVIYLEDGDIATVSAEEFQIWHREIPSTRKIHAVTWSPQDLDKAGYEHFMLKEIHEQPRVIRDTLAGRILSTAPGVNLGIDLSKYGKPEEILLLACGSAYHACLVGQHFLSSFASCPVSTRIASESEIIRPAKMGAWAIVVSQSGETADTISAARAARNAGYFTLAVTNNTDSSITRAVHEVLYTQAGPEMSVAATKTFLAQLTALYLLGLSLFPPPLNTLHNTLSELRLLPAKIQRVIGMAEQFQSLARNLAGVGSLFIVGKGINYPITLEGSLKFKEVAYIHAEGYPAGELKHGTFALLGMDTPVIAIMSKDDTYARLLNTVKEIKSRGAPVIALTDSFDGEVSQLVDYVVRLPITEPLISPVINSVALQLLAYYSARVKECPIDRPRNLAKSVTVH
ncbi:glutamine--fructose-6-phosphate transaminase (isomerizing) [SAR202 cluster bacterium AD-802-E10_MRT_200m]|nr:glutamine--fructose-6-phosphate transaminase (isomerizing) [SAR202 cluster bacterium AD-802-E10_MRT_200m]